MKQIDRNRTWIAFANRAICRHSDAILELGYINWRMGNNFHFEIGDTVYLFMSDERKIRFKMAVVEKNCTRTDGNYWIEKASDDLTYRLSFVDEYQGNKLGEAYLEKYGFSGGSSIQTPSSKNTDLIEYVDSIFASEHIQEIELRSKPMLYVDLNSGKYWKTNIGHEVFNLDKNPVDGRYYGYCPPDGVINITNLGAKKNDDTMSGVIVIYTTKIKNSSNREIVAFCENATIHRYPVCEEKVLKKLKRKLEDGSKKYCSYSIESDELIDLSSVASKFIIRVSDYNTYMFRKQRFYKGTYKELDEKVITYISNYLSKGDDEDDLGFQKSVQSAEISSELTDTAKEIPEYVDGNNSKAVKKSSKISKWVLERSKYICAGDSSHKTFCTNKGVAYMEGHHLIPCTYSNAQYFWKTRKRNIDCVENIVCLCPTCHRKIHFGSTDEKRTLIKTLYKKQITQLSSVNLAITLNELYKLYNV